MNGLAANRYAEAFFYLSEDVDMTDVYFSELDDSVNTIAQNKELFDVLRSPFISEEEKKAVLDEAFKDIKNKDVLNFLKILIEKHRIGVVIAIKDKVKDLIEDKKNIVEGEVISVVELEPSQVKTLEEKLSKKYYKTVKLTAKVDKDVIGGVLVKVGNEQIDGTVRGRLNRLNEKLTIFI